MARRGGGKAIWLLQKQRQGQGETVTVEEIEVDTLKDYDGIGAVPTSIIVQ
jgi:hypothetical protein